MNKYLSKLNIFLRNQYAHHFTTIRLKYIKLYYIILLYIKIYTIMIETSEIDIDSSSDSGKKIIINIKHNILNAN